MARFSFYLPEINQLTGISEEDWHFLCELAAENNTPPATFAAQIIASELVRYREEIQYAEEVQQELDLLAAVHEKSVEEALS